jgi:hypothetical protein
MATAMSPPRQQQLATVYLLRLEHGKWYVGKSTDIVSRIISHRAGSDVAWVRAHPMLDYSILGVDNEGHMEDNKTIDEMYARGWRNVRGGMYCQMELTAAHQDDIRRRMCSLRNLCYACARPMTRDHIASRCTQPESEEHASRVPSRAPVAAAPAVAEQWQPGHAVAAQLPGPLAWGPYASGAGLVRAGATLLGIRPREEVAPAGRDAHLEHPPAWQPPARGGAGGAAAGHPPREVVGGGYGGANAVAREDNRHVRHRGDPSAECERCGRDSHTAVRCFARVHADGRRLSDEDEDDDGSDTGDRSQVRRRGGPSMECARCGRDSHTAAGCYARVHANGGRLSDEDEDDDDSDDSDDY